MTNTTDAGLPTVGDRREAVLNMLRIAYAEGGEFTGDEARATLNALIARARADGEAAGRIAGLKQAWCLAWVGAVPGRTLIRCAQCANCRLLIEAERPSAPA